MRRAEIIDKIGLKYYTSNMENGEFNYQKALNDSISGNKYSINGHKYLDLRFELDKYSILVETKQKKNGKYNFDDKDIKQIEDYYQLEKKYKKENKVIYILYDIESEIIKVWQDGVELEDENSINSMSYYISLYEDKKNDKSRVIQTTNELNNKLHKFGIKESLRSQFVGSLLVAINNDLQWSDGLKTIELINRVQEILESKIENDENKKIKTDLLIKILKEQQIKELKPIQFCEILNLIKENIIPFIDNKSSQGEDLLNLFFTTFNKYVGKADKNQAFTPTHITDFMCEITKINKHSKILDPTCGSGSFLVQAMTKMLKDAGNDEETRKNIKKNQLFGIESEEKVFGLATTNMLIHEDGKTNVVKDSVFNREEWIKEKNIDVILMNPPFNANGNNLPEKFGGNNGDSTKGFCFVKYVADIVNKGMLATILPLACAIGNSEPIKKIKKEMLEKHTLKAVFTMNDELFYPGANVNSCVMLFELGHKHDNTYPTFFGYYKNDGFIKRKNRGRVEKTSWEETKKQWLDLFKNQKEVPGLSIKHNVTYKDEWLAEAYMETDYSALSEENFVQSLRDFLAFKVKNGKYN